MKKKEIDSFGEPEIIEKIYDFKTVDVSSVQARLRFPDSTPS